MLFRSRLRQARGLGEATALARVTIAAPAAAMLELDPDTAAARVIEQRQQAHAAADAATEKLVACLRILRTRQTPETSEQKEDAHA